MVELLKREQPEKSELKEDGGCRDQRYSSEVDHVEDSIKDVWAWGLGAGDWGFGTWGWGLGVDSNQ